MCPNRVIVTLITTLNFKRGYSTALLVVLILDDCTAQSSIDNFLLSLPATYLPSLQSPFFSI